ncbi:enoyl-CoA hydratase/isomerase family protein [Mucilaginibacter gotjawali]|uniref:Enoyl-CoA hydratase/carnithine racemase n=2 Tax=Mucilaginibacter gotjawali TaxID=1550579 RepID=A0A839SPW6_9SPHI|nr:enoyl-CoA hydratase/isomerase family protein [Mucilaginibacter gotjawali]MBB3058519.1 enoyl-CoA hydratase/carnithine racemase [Mucilaginibacter gotjawali]BAU55743.1 putative enoyl-CoA hydratase echA8 [Mucilaginibacter gotjawali]
METIQIAVNDKIAVVTLDRGRSNPINHQMVKELTNCIKDLENDDRVGGVILTGKEGFFSSGADLMEVYGYDEQQARAFWTDFFALQSTLIAFKKPIVAALSGHSPAGGCVLAVCCDYRLMAEGEYIIGLNEIPVGIIVPEGIFKVYAFWIGKQKAYQFLLEGKLVKVNEALQIGLIDEVCQAEDLLAQAEKKVKTYMQFNPVTWSQSKLNLRQELISDSNTDQSATLNQMLKQWWAPETRATLEVIIQNLKARSSAPKK